MKAGIKWYTILWKSTQVAVLAFYIWMVGGFVYHVKVTHDISVDSQNEAFARSIARLVVQYYSYDKQFPDLNNDFDYDAEYLLNRGKLTLAIISSNEFSISIETRRRGRIVVVERRIEDEAVDD